MPSKRTFRKRTPKARMERWHAIRRAKERYGLVLTVADLEALAADIQQGLVHYEVVEEQSCRVRVYDLEVQGVPVRIVYDKVRGAVTSFIPRGEPVRHS